MPHVDPLPTVLIKDENGVERPWTIIPRPETIEKNCSIRKLMELGSDNSDSDSDSDSDSGDNAKDDNTTRARCAIYRSIWRGISHALNSIVPGAVHGKLKWKNITSAERSAVHAEVVENNPYLCRFEGGWISELIMQRQLRNARDTATRKAKQDQALNLKPLDHLSKKSRAQTKKKLLASKKKASTSSKSQATAPATPIESSGNPIVTATATSSASNSVPPAHKRRSNVNPGPSAANNSNAEGSEPLSDGEPSAPIAPDRNTQQKSLFAYFKPKPVAQPISTNKKRAKTSANSQDKETESESSDNEDEAWSRDINTEIAGLKSKSTNTPLASSSTTKRSKPSPTPESTVPKKSAVKPRPKARPPPGANDKTEEPDLFRRNTRAAKQELIDNTDTATVKERSPKSSSNSRKNTRGKKK
ncbi:unnamed protein product [Rhizoctonia solani]|uniref:Uncharacterized protein n=2 Tax=Rhizoctonia solani TaxID=456999 RepID=A0A8H3ARX4_9AGAM|nr:unnamed protein product [Rhizoctonia solani]